MQTNKNNQINWGFIGCGDVTEIKSGPAYQLVEGFAVSAVMRRNPEKLADYAKRHRIAKTYIDADALIKDHEIDAVYIATPPDSHLEYALKVAEAGKICCIEKPMAVNYQQSLAIYEVFEEKQIPLFVAYYRRNLARFLKIKEWVDNSEIGQIAHVHWVYERAASTQDLAKTYNWRTDKNIAPGGYFDDLACHGLDIFSFLLGDFQEAKGDCKNRLGLYSAYDLIQAEWQHVSGCTGAALWNFGADEYNDEVVIYGDKGKIAFSIFGDKPISLTLAGRTLLVEIANPNPIQLPYVEAMKRYLFDGNKTPISTGKTAVHTAWVMGQVLGFPTAE